MLSPYTYEVKDGNGNVVKSGSFQLDAGKNTTVSVSGVYGVLTLFITDDKGTTTQAATTTCVESPKLVAAGSCTEVTTAEASFTITNNGGDMTSSYTYEVKDSNGNMVKSGSFQLDKGKSTTIPVSGVYGTLTLFVTNDKNVTTQVATTTCIESPKLAAVGICTAANATEATFTITNNGGDMPKAYSYEVKDSNGNVLASSTFQLDAKKSTSVTIKGVSGVLTLFITDDKNVTAQAATTTCIELPKLVATGLCTEDTAQATFTITNNGGAMPKIYTYEIKDSNGNVVKTDTFQLGAKQSTTITVSGVYNGLTLFITDDQSVTAQAATAYCAETVPPVVPAESQPCIQCLIFHTFRDDNLEIYRLDGVEGEADFKLYNLSQDEAVDSRPSRAPNDSNVVFQSNRDGNVELYYTDMIGSGEAIRLTKTNSNNTNPMYGPDARTIVYQSDRNGNFDLFTIDQVTGNEVQITSDSADDANPFYSPDLKWLVFQSNRNNNWDIFALNIETGNEYQLTNTPADEVFPSWSPNGKQISFLIDTDGATDLYIMDTNGENIKRITKDGKTNNPVWSPEGDRIAYQSERNGNLDIYSYDVKAGKEYHVTDYAGLDSGPTWDCGGDNLAFTSDRDGDANVFQVYWQGGAAGNMTIDPATDKWSQWRPSNDVSSVGY